MVLLQIPAILTRLNNIDLIILNKRNHFSFKKTDTLLESDCLHKILQLNSFLLTLFNLNNEIFSMKPFHLGDITSLSG